MPLLQTTTAEGALKGMVLARAPHELGEQEAAYLQDCIINKAGFVSRRGAITGTTSLGNNLDGNRPESVGVTFDPKGNLRIGVFYTKQSGATGYEMWCAMYDSTLTFIQKHWVAPVSNSSWAATRAYQCNICPGIDGSLIINIAKNYGARGFSERASVKWNGACPATSIAAAGATITITTTDGAVGCSASVADVAKISVGTYIQNVGMVINISSTTTFELMYPAPQTFAGVLCTVSPFEWLQVWRSRGKVSCTAGVLTGVTGYGTKFKEANDLAQHNPSSGFLLLDATTMKTLAMLNANAPNMAASDTVTGIPGTVPRSAAMGSYILASEGPTVALGFPMGWHYHYGPQPDTGTGLPFAPAPRAARGWMWTTYKGFNISFNGEAHFYSSGIDPGDSNLASRFYVHGPRFPEIMDHSAADGDWQDVTSLQGGDNFGTAIQAGRDCVILCKQQETYALLGDDPSNFSITKIADDGSLGQESATSYKGSPIWLGKTGIWSWSPGMSEPENLVGDTLGSRWTELVSSFVVDAPGSGISDADFERKHQARCFTYRDYLFVNVTTTNNLHSVYTDGVARTQDPVYLAIYLPTRAVTYLTNFNFQGFFQVGQKGYVVFPQSGSTTHHFFPLDNLFTQGLATSDTILTSNSYFSGTLSTSVGPWFHMESRKFDGGDGLWKKAWKQLAVEFKETNTKRMWLETVAGLNTTGVRAVLPFTGTGSFLAARTKFRTRNQYMSFRLYEDISNRPDTLTLGAWQWGYKFARRGAV